jgi:fucose permease
MLGIAVAVNTPPMCLTALTDTFLLTDTQRGVLLGALFWGFVAAIVCTGPLGDRFGYKPFLVLASGLQIGGLVLSATAQSYAALLTGATVLGVGSGVLEVLVSPLVCVLRPHERTRAMNLCHGFYSVGAIGTLALSMHLLKLQVSWRAIYLTMTVPVLLYGLGFLTCRLPRPERQNTNLASVLPWRERVFWLMLVAMLLIAGTEIGPHQWMSAYLEEVFHFARETAGSGLVLFAVMMALGRFAMGSLPAKYVPLRVLLLNCVGSAACIALAGTTHSRVVAVASFACLGWFVSAFWPTVLAHCADRIPNGGITMFGALSAVGNSGGIVFPTMVGWLADQSSLRTGMLSLAVVPLLAGGLFVWELARDADAGS